VKLDKFILSVLVFSVIITGGLLIVANEFDTYDVDSNVSDSFGDVYDTIDETYNLSQDMKEQTLEGDIESGSSSWESMATDSYSALRLITTSFTLVGDILDAIAREMGIPSFFVKAGMTALAISIIFSLIYLIFRYQSG